ncbi:MAG: metal ABC transporter permease [Thermodesulfobacteriota bacterium]
MIRSFLSSWVLFYQSYLTGWLISLLLSIIGVLVVARDQIFIGAAVSQASTLGIALIMWASVVFRLEQFSWFQSDIFLSAMAVIFSILAASITGRGGETGKESHEAITGWVFLISASLSILIVSHSPHGLEEIHRLLSSSIIGATTSDIWSFSLLTLLTVFLILLFYRKILLFALDPSMASAIGMKMKIWSLATSAWLGLAIGLSIRASGMLYTFGCLVLPALVAKNLCREVRQMFFVAPIVAMVIGIIGFVLANYYDYPPGQMTVAFFCLLLVSVWFFRRLSNKGG